MDFGSCQNHKWPTRALRVSTVQQGNSKEASPKSAVHHRGYHGHIHVYVNQLDVELFLAISSQGEKGEWVRVVQQISRGGQVT